MYSFLPHIVSLFLVRYWIFSPLLGLLKLLPMLLSEKDNSLLGRAAHNSTLHVRIKAITCDKRSLVDLASFQGTINTLEASDLG